MKKSILTALFALLCFCSVLRGQDTVVKWSVSASDAGDGLYELVFSGTVDAGWQQLFKEDLGRAETAAC